MSISSGIVDSSSATVPQVKEAKADITGKGEDLDLKSFLDFGVSEPIANALAEKGILHPFPIQALTLPVALRRHDIIGQAKTGTGKTLGFGIPMLLRTASVSGKMVGIPSRRPNRENRRDWSCFPRVNSPNRSPPS